MLKEIFRNLYFEFRGLSDEQETQFTAIVEKLGASSTPQDETYILAPLEYFNKHKLNNKSVLYDISYIRDCVEREKLLNIQNYRFCPQSVKCFAARFILRTACCCRFYEQILISRTLYTKPFCSDPSSKNKVPKTERNVSPSRNFVRQTEQLRSPSKTSERSANAENRGENANNSSPRSRRPSLHQSPVKTVEKPVKLLSIKSEIFFDAEPEYKESPELFSPKKEDDISELQTPAKSRRESDHVINILHDSSRQKNLLGSPSNPLYNYKNIVNIKKDLSITESFSPVEEDVKISPLKASIVFENKENCASPEVNIVYESFSHDHQRAEKNTEKSNDVRGETKEVASSSNGESVNAAKNKSDSSVESMDYQTAPDHIEPPKRPKRTSKMDASALSELVAKKSRLNLLSSTLEKDKSTDLDNLVNKMSSSGNIDPKISSENANENICSSDDNSKSTTPDSDDFESLQIDSSTSDENNQK